MILVHVCSCLLLYTEQPIEFITKLKSQEVAEDESVTFKCELSKPAKTVTWLKNGKIVESNEDHDITNVDTQCTLTISKAQVDDSGEYSVKVGDKESTAKLVVKGEQIFDSMLSLSGDIQSLFLHCL